MTAHEKHAQQGFTLVEMMMASAISVILVAAVFTAFIFQRHAFEAQQRVNEMQQNVRTALDTLTHDLHLAGYGLRRIPPYKVGDWITWVTGMTDNPMVIQGGGTVPDELLIAGVFENPVTTTSAIVTNGAKSITVADASEFNTIDRKVIYIGRSETARIIGKAGNTLTISTHATESKGLRYGYEVGAPIELVQVVRYAWANPAATYPFEPHLTREIEGRTYSQNWQKLCAGNIEDFQLTRNFYSMEMAVTGRTSTEDYKYVDPDHNDGYRRMTVARTFYPRNAKLWK
jgi:prepilin-type N-terminal cleavage/methylation domain-containing protein